MTESAAPLKMLEALQRRATATRADSWQNEVTGFGTTRDKTTYGAFQAFAPLTDWELSNLYHGDDMAARMVDIVPQEMLREGFEVDLDDADANSALANKLAELDVREKLLESIRWGRLFGGAALLIGADDGRPAWQSLIAERAKDLSYLYVLDRRLLWPVTWYTERGHPKLGEPEVYMVAPLSRMDSNVVTVHESRLVLFRGAPTGYREREQLNGWDLSVLQRPWEILRQFNSGWKAVEIMLTDGNQAVMQMSGLADAIATGSEEAIRTRAQLIDMYRSVLRMLVVDAGTDTEKPESIERLSVSFEQIPQTLDKLMLRLAASVRIPVTVLMGQSPAGMNATGESDFRWFYDGIRSEQNNYLAPRIRRIVDVLLAVKNRVVTKPPESIAIKFPPLWTETPKAEAERRNIIASADKTYVDAKVLTPEEVALSRFRPEGFASEIKLTEEAVTAREATLDRKLESQKEGLEPTPAQAGVSAVAPPKPVKPGLAVLQDAPDLLERLSGERRVVITGGPRTGKTVLGARASERFGLELRSTDSLVGTEQWGDDSEHVARWLQADGEWVIEGVTAVRAIRKWLDANPEQKLRATVVWLRDARQKQSEGQRTMARGVETIWDEIRPELERRGVKIIDRDT